MAECALGIAKEEFLEGHLHNACYWLDTALRDAAATSYHTHHITAPAIVYFRFMRGISPSLCSYEAEDLVPGERDLAAWQDPFCRYVLITEQIHQHLSVPQFHAGTGDERHLSLHLEAMMAKEQGDWAKAMRLLEQILADEIAPVPVVLLHVLADLEHCCKMLEDYKGAYSHSIHKLSVLEKLLAESTV